MPSETTTALIEDASTYAEKFKIFQLFESLLQELVVTKPDKPLDHLISVLKRSPVPRVIVSGPPGAEARSLCELVAAKAGLVHVNAADLWKELSQLNFAPAVQAKALVDDGKEVPDGLTVAMLKEKLTKDAACVKSGWVLEGFPATGAAARAMLAEGLLPTRFLQISVSDAECMRRLTGRRIDPDSNTVYHVEDAPPPADVAGRLVTRPLDAKDEVSKRLLAYRQGMLEVLPCFKTVAAEIDNSKPGDKGLQSLLAAAMPLITADMPSRAPRGCARVLLLGGPGSNTEQLGAALAQTYGAKHISAIELLHGAALNGGKQAAKAMASAQPLVAGDSIVGPLIVDRIKREDVRTAGFVLTGFPATTQQAAFLAKKGVWLRNVVHLKLEPAAAEKLVTGTRYDPVDGEAYNISDGIDDSATASRVVVHPKDTPAAFKSAMKMWKSTLDGLSKTYEAELSTEDAARPEGELVERLAPCFLSL